MMKRFQFSNISIYLQHLTPLTMIYCPTIRHMTWASLVQLHLGSHHIFQKKKSNYANKQFTFLAVQFLLPSLLSYSLTRLLFVLWNHLPCPVCKSTSCVLPVAYWWYGVIQIKLCKWNWFCCKKCREIDSDAGVLDDEQQLTNDCW